MNNILEARRIAPVWGIQLGANVVLLAFAYWWLLWPDAHAWQVIASMIAAGGIVFLTAWLHTGTLCYLETGGTVRSAFRRSLGRVPAFLIWAVAFALVLWSLGWVRDNLLQASVRGAQIVGGSPRRINSASDWLVAILQYVVVPAFFFAFIPEIADRGFRGWHLRALRRWKQARYWVALAIGLLAGALLPYKLIWWFPVTGSSLTAEAWSAALRFAVAHLLAVSAWVAFASVLSADVAPTMSPLPGEGSPTTEAA